MSGPGSRRPASADETAVAASIAGELLPVPMGHEQGAMLQRRLFERVRRSVEAHREFTTVRREDGAWSAVAAGVDECVLHESGGIRSLLLRVAAGATVPWSPAAHAEEVLVTEGSLVVDGSATSTTLAPLGQLVVGHASPRRLYAGADGARLYLRCRVVDVEQLPASEARWWIAAQNAALPAAGQAPRWSRFLPGVDAVDLRTHGGVASMLLRMAPGAVLPDHGHSLDEDCLMVEGEVFLGDVLVRAGDYQIVRAGGHHVGVMSDAGGLFFFHGAVPGLASAEAA